MRISFFSIAVICVALCGCKWLSDDGVHLAESMKAGAKALQRSADTELTVAFEPLDGTNQIYTVQICKDSAVVVWSKHGGSSTYQLNYVSLPKDFLLHKTNEATFITLRKDGDRVDVVNAQ